jgi:hypothetical protein
MSSNSDFAAHCRVVIAKARLRGTEPQAINKVSAALHAFESGQGGLDKLRQLTKRLSKRANLIRLPTQERPKPRKKTGIQIVQGGAPG